MTPVLSLLSATGVALVLTMVSVGLSLTATHLEAGDLVLVVAAPWGPQAHDIIRSSGLNETYPVRAPLGGLTQLSTPSDAGRLRENGAWLLLDGKRIAALCQ